MAYEEGFEGGLLTQPEFADHREIPLPLRLAEIFEQIAALGDQLEQPATAGKILLVSSHVLGQFVDSGGEQRDLHFRRPGVAFSSLVLTDELSLFFLRNRHRPGPQFTSSAAGIVGQRVHDNGDTFLHPFTVWRAIS